MTAAFGSTTTKVRSTQLVLDEANANELPAALQQLKLGTVHAPLKRTFTGLTGAASYDLTALDASGETAGVANANRLPAAHVRTLRVTAATTANTVGTYIVSDASGTKVSPTASTVVGIATISDDGKTLAFPTADVTAFIIEYIPLTLSAAQMAAVFAPST